MQHPRADAHAAERPAGHEHPPAELRPRRLRRQVPAATFDLAQAVVGIEDAPPGDDIPGLRQRLDRHRPPDPLPRHSLEILQSFLQAWNQPEDQVREHDECDQLEHTPCEQLARLVKKSVPAKVQTAAWLLIDVHGVHFGRLEGTLACTADSHVVGRP